MASSAAGGVWGRGLRLQSAVELLMVYSWVILIVAIVVSVAFILSFSTPTSSYLPSTCYIQTLFTCQDTLLSGNYLGKTPITYIVIFTNELQTPVSFPLNSLNVTMTNIGNFGTAVYTGNCTPNIAMPGAQVTCSETVPGALSPTIGSRVSTQFELNYKTCTSGSLSSCGTSVYKTSGYATQSIEGQLVTSSPYIVTLTINTILSKSVAVNDVGAAGFVLINGVPYPNGTVLYMPKGTYMLYADPLSGNGWVSYNVVSGTSTLGASPPGGGSAITLTLNSNTILQSQFTEAVCNVCNGSISGTPICPAACPTIGLCPKTVPTVTTTSSTTTTINPAPTTSTIGYYSCEPACNNAAPGYSCPSSCPTPVVCNGTVGVECVHSTGFSAQRQGAAVQSVTWAQAEQYLVTINPTTTVGTTTSTSTSTTTTVSAGSGATVDYCHT